MERHYPDLPNPLEWNLVGRENLTILGTGGGYISELRARNFVIEQSWLVAVGISVYPAKSTWFTGGWASQILPISPSSTSTYAAMLSGRRWIKRNVLTLMEFPKLTDLWILELTFPYWLEYAEIEVWRYDGRDLSWYDPQS